MSSADTKKAQPRSTGGGCCRRPGVPSCSRHSVPINPGAAAISWRRPPPRGYAVGGVEVVGGAGVAAAAAVTALSFTRSFNSLLGLKNGIFLAGTSTRSPVLGLRPTRGLRWRVRKLPKPRISILSPTRSERTILSKMVSTMTSLSLRVNSASRETSSIRSAFVIHSSLHIDLSRRGASASPPLGLHKLLKFKGLWQEAFLNVAFFELGPGTYFQR